MRTDYLHRTAAIQFDSSGNGTAVISPDVGQYWQLGLIRVSTVNQGTPFPYCAVYVGPQANISYFLDDTYTGQSDATSLCSSLVIQHGESVFAVWANGHTFDTAVLTLWGVVTSGG